VGGATNSSDFPVTTGAYSTACGYPGSECQGGHLTKLNSSGQMVWSTYIGGAKQDGSDVMSYTGPVQLDGKGNVYFIGTTSFGFPWINPAEPWAKGAGGVDVVVVELDPTGSQLLFSSVVGSGGLDGSGPGGMAVDSAGNIYVGAWINGPDLITTPGAFQTKDPTPVCCTVHGYVAKITLAVTAPLPTITAVVNGASFAGGKIAPGEIVTLGGTNLGPVNALGLTLNSAGQVSTSLGNVSVSFNGYLAPLIYVSATQINCVVPYEVAKLISPFVQVTYAGQTSNAYPLSATATAPGIFTLNGQGSGPGAVLNASGSVNGSNSPAVKGGTIVIFMTGEGQTGPAGVTGSVTAVNTSGVGPLTPQPLLPVAVTIGGQPATVSFYGEAPGLVAGVMQVNVIVPAAASSGIPNALVVSVGGNPSQTGVTVAVQ
jgi:uncharacterized protein (TIGR03437 family)